MTTQEVKKMIQKKFASSTAQTSDIIKYVLSKDESVPPATVSWVLYDIVKNKEAVRFGRGVYFFSLKPTWHPVLSEKAAQVADLIMKQMPYLKATIADTSVLNELMEQQPFSYAIIIEVPKRLIDSVVQKLVEGGIMAFSRANSKLGTLYSRSNISVYVTKAVKTSAVIPYKGNINTSTLEKLMVDILAVPELYGLSQSGEAENIFINASENYALDYSMMLKYATNRGKRKEAVDLLTNSRSYQLYREAII